MKRTLLTPGYAPLRAPRAAADNGKNGNFSLHRVGEQEGRDKHYHGLTTETEESEPARGTDVPCIGHHRCKVVCKNAGILLDVTYAAPLTTATSRLAVLCRSFFPPT